MTGVQTCALPILIRFDDDDDYDEDNDTDEDDEDLLDDGFYYDDEQDR